jgi:hypothetical protein
MIVTPKPSLSCGKVAEVLRVIRGAKRAPITQPFYLATLIYGSGFAPTSNLQKDFRPRSGEHFFQIEPEWGILTQESGCLDSIIARFYPSDR